MAPTSTTSSSDDSASRIAALESAIAERDVRIADLTRERDELRAAYDRLWVEVELMRRRIFVAKAERVDTTTTGIATAPMPPQIFPRALATVSLIARIAVDKYGDGLPLHRQEDRFERQGLPSTAARCAAGSSTPEPPPEPP